MTSALVSYLESLVKNPERPNRAALAALRRGLGKMPGEAPELFPHVVPFIGEPAGSAATADYIVASLFGAHPVPWRPAEDAPRNTSFGWTMRFARMRKDSTEEDTGVVRRFQSALAADRAELPTHLRQLIRLLDARAPGALINWDELRRDLTHWDDPRRWVQRRWAEAFWRAQPAENTAAGSDDASDGADPTN